MARAGSGARSRRGPDVRRRHPRDDRDGRTTDVRPARLPAVFVRLVGGRACARDRRAVCSTSSVRSLAQARRPLRHPALCRPRSRVARRWVSSGTLVTHDMGDTVGVSCSPAPKVRRFCPSAALTNGSIYIGMAQLWTGQQFLLALDDERADVGGSGEQRFGLQAGHRGHVRTRYPASDAELDAQRRLRRTRTATCCCPARSATSRIGAPRRTVHWRDRTASVAARCGGRADPDRGACMTAGCSLCFRTRR